MQFRFSFYKKIFRQMNERMFLFSGSSCRTMWTSRFHEQGRSTMTKVLGDVLRHRREEKGLSQVEVAAGICSSSLLSMIEGAKASPSPRTLALLLKRLDLTRREVMVATARTDRADGQFQFRLAVALLDADDVQGAAEQLARLDASSEAVVPVQERLIAEARCAWGLGRLATARRLIEEAYLEAAARGSAVHLYECASWQARWLEQQGRWPEALWQLERCHQLLQRFVPPDPIRAESLSLRIDCARAQAGSPFVPGAPVAKHNLSSAFRAADELARARTCQANGDRARAEEHLARAEAVHREQERLLIHAHGARRQAVALTKQGLLEEAYDWYEQARRIAEAAGDEWEVARLYGEMTLVALQAGRTQVAADVQAKLFQLADHTATQ